MVQNEQFIDPEDNWLYKPPQPEPTPPVTWQNIHTLTPEQLAQFESEWQPKDGWDRAFQFMDLNARRLIMIGAVTAWFTLSSPITIYEPLNKQVKTELTQAVRGSTVKAATELVEAYQHNHRLMKMTADLGTPGGIELYMEAYPNSKQMTETKLWLKTNKKGELDPQTVYGLDVMVVGCDPKFCGGNGMTEEEIDVTEVKDVKGAPIWGVEDVKWPANSNNASQDISTYIKDTNTKPSSVQAKLAVSRARLFSRVAEIDSRQALSGKIVIQKAEKPIDIA